MCPLCLWLLSFSILFSRFIYVVACVSTIFLVMISTVWMDIYIWMDIYDIKIYLFLFFHQLLGF